jgi:hypothetical protein
LELCLRLGQRLLHIRHRGFDPFVLSAGDLHQSFRFFAPPFGLLKLFAQIPDLRFGGGDAGPQQQGFLQQGSNFVLRSHVGLTFLSRP